MHIDFTPDHSRQEQNLVWAFVVQLITPLYSSIREFRLFILILRKSTNFKDITADSITLIAARLSDKITIFRLEVGSHLIRRQVMYRRYLCLVDISTLEGNDLDIWVYPGKLSFEFQPRIRVS